MDYVATQEAEVLPPLIKLHILGKVASSRLKSNKRRSRTNIHRATRPAAFVEYQREREYFKIASHGLVTLRTLHKIIRIII
jgi:hypothetical protein